MRDLRHLLWLSRVNFLRRNERRYTQDDKMYRRLGRMRLLYSLLPFIMLGYSGFFSYGLYTLGLPGLLIPYATATAAFVILLITLLRGHGVLFDTRGSDTLFSLPLCLRSIVLARLVLLYLPALAAAALLILPASIFEAALSGGGVGYFVRAALLTLVTPLLPMALGLLLAYAVALLTRRMRSKQLVIALLSFAAAAGLMLLFYSLQWQDTSYIKDIVLRLRTPLLRAYPPAALAQEALNPSGWGALLLYAVSGMVPILAIAWILTRSLARLAGSLQAAHPGAARQSVSARQRTPLAAMLHKEFRRLLASPLYLLNTAAPAWLAPIMLTALPLVAPQIKTQLAQSPQAAVLAARLLPAALCFLSSVSTTTAVSLSLEGKSAWLACTAPVPPRLIYRAKITLSLLMTAAPTIAGALSAVRLFALPACSLLAAIILPCACAALCAVVGLRLDFRYRRFDWQSEQEMVKQSLQVMLTMAAGLGLTLAAAAILYLAAAYAPYAALALAALYVLAAWLLYLRLRNRPLYLVAN